MSGPGPRCCAKPARGSDPRSNAVRSFALSPDGWPERYDRRRDDRLVRRDIQRCAGQKHDAAHEDCRHS